MIWLVGLAAGLVAGLLKGGRLDGFTRLKFRWPALVLAAVGIRVAILLPPLNRIGGAQWLYAAALAVIVGWCLGHVGRLPGVWLVAAGGALNLIVILVNGGHMPVAAALADGLLERGTLGQYEVMSSSTVLNPLADWIPFPPTGEAYSPGDLVIAAGLALVAFRIARQKPDPGPIRPSRAV